MYLLVLYIAQQSKTAFLSVEPKGTPLTTYTFLPSLWAAVLFSNLNRPRMMLQFSWLSFWWVSLSFLLIKWSFLRTWNFPFLWFKHWYLLVSPKEWSQAWNFGRLTYLWIFFIPLSNWWLLFKYITQIWNQLPQSQKHFEIFFFHFLLALSVAVRILMFKKFCDQISSPAFFLLFKAFSQSLSLSVTTLSI